MSNPFAGFNSVPSPQVVPIAPRQPGVIERMLPHILWALEFTKKRKMEQAGNVMSGIQPGTTYGSLTEEQQKAVQRFYGRKEKDFLPTTVVRPVESAQQDIFNRLDQIMPPGSPLRNMYDLAGARGQLAGAPQAPESAFTVTTRAETQETEAETQRRLAQIGQQQVAGAARAREAIQAGAKPETLTPGQVMDFRQVFGFVPSEPMKAQMSNQLNMGVMQESLRVLGNPEASTLAPVLQEMGINVADGIGSVALGLDQFVRDAANNRAAIWASMAQGEADLTKTENDLAKAISEKSGGRIPIPIILGIWAGKPEVINSPMGQAAVAFMNTGFDAAMTSGALAADPGVTNWDQVRPLMTAFAKDPQALANLLDVRSGIIARALTRAELGVEPTDDARDPESGEFRRDQWNRRYQAWKDRIGPSIRSGRRFGLGGLIGTITGTGIGATLKPTEQNLLPNPGMAGQDVTGNVRGVVPGSQQGLIDFLRASGGTYDNLLPLPPGRGPQP